MKYLPFVAYYFYAIIIVFGTGYIVFFKGESGWWFALTCLLLNVTPTIKNGSNGEDVQ